MGSRLAEETVVRPKPMVEIGGRPILWHIMKIYGHYGINDFVICLGYKGYVIKEYFYNYHLHVSDVTIDVRRGTLVEHRVLSEPWRVTLIDTGDESMTGGRLKRAAPYIGDETFCFTYGDGLTDLDISDSIRFHHAHGKQATVTSILPPGRFGVLEVQGHRVTRFKEKMSAEDSRINGGFFVLEPSVLETISDDATIREKDPMEQLAAEGELMAYEHNGFWQSMDTLRDKLLLEDLWSKGAPPWRVWR